VTRITGHNRDEIVKMLATIPLPVVKSRTGLSYSTLAKIAKVAL